MDFAEMFISQFVHFFERCILEKAGFGTRDRKRSRVIYLVYFWEGEQMVGLQRRHCFSSSTVDAVASSAQRPYLTVSRQAITGYSSLFLVPAM
jgi:hypothetical protein